MNKKGVEITLNTIIIAAICLITMIIIIGAFTNWFGQTNTNIGAISGCESMGNGKGNCYTKDDSARENMNCIFRYGGCGSAAEDDKAYCCWPK